MTHPAKELSPWRRCELLERAIAGESLRALEEEFCVHRATINRWLAKCRDEWSVDYSRGVQQKVVDGAAPVHA